ncbi:MAG: hypothetical protein V1771_01960, partial [Chloroflexota bacterium]
MNHIIRPIVKEFDYTAIRADAISEPGMITSQIIDHLINDALVIADLTGGNPNVYYELAVRHLLKRPVVQLIHVNEKVSFDVTHQRTIQFDYQDLDSVECCKDELRKQIATVEKDPSKVDSPISQAIDTRGLLKSQDPAAKGMAQIIEMLLDVKITLAQMSYRATWSPEASYDVIEALVKHGLYTKPVADDLEVLLKKVKKTGKAI